MNCSKSIVANLLDGKTGLCLQTLQLYPLRLIASFHIGGTIHFTCWKSQGHARRNLLQLSAVVGLESWYQSVSTVVKDVVSVSALLSASESIYTGSWDSPCPESSLVDDNHYPQVAIQQKRLTMLILPPVAFAPCYAASDSTTRRSLPLRGLCLKGYSVHGDNRDCHTCKCSRFPLWLSSF